MTEQENERLRTLLAEEVRRYAKMQYVSKAMIRLNEDTGYGLTTEAEITVFGLDEQMIPSGQIAYMAYEELLDFIFPSRFDEETHALICKARAIVPNEDEYGRKVVFEDALMDKCAFLWFAKHFFDLPNRQAAAIYAKHEWSDAHLVRYADEQR